MEASIAFRKPTIDFTGSLHVRPLLGEPDELTMEILRLLVLSPNHKEIQSAMGFTAEEHATLLVSRLPESGTAWFTADDGRRMKGIISLQPDPWPSAYLGYRVWRMEHLALAPDAQPGTAAALIKEGLASLGRMVDFVVARVSSSDGAAVRELGSTGFRFVGHELEAAARLGGHSDLSVDEVRVVPMELQHIGVAAGMAVDCRRYNLYSPEAGFDGVKISSLYDRLLRTYVKEPEQWGLVALDSDGMVLAFAAYQLEVELEMLSGRRLASLDYLCVRKDSSIPGLAKLLGRRALTDLGKMSVQAAKTRVMLDDHYSLGVRASFADMGNATTATNMVFHKWL
jgi:hypothetical protein